MSYSPWPTNTVCLSHGLFSVKTKQKKVLLHDDYEEDEDGFRMFPKAKREFTILNLEKMDKSKNNVFCNNVPEGLFKMENEDGIYSVQSHIKNYGSMIPERELDFCLQFLLCVLYYEDILQQYIDEENGEEEKVNQKFFDFCENGYLSNETREFLFEIMKKDAEQQTDSLLNTTKPWENNIFGAFQVISTDVFDGHCQIKFLPTGEIICQDAGFEVFGKMIVEEYCRMFPLKKIQQCTSFHDLFIL